MLFFALDGSTLLGRRIAAAGGFSVALHEERDFGGGEHKSRPLVSVRGKDVFVLHGLQGTGRGSANDRLMRLLLFVAACRENGASRVTAIAPYLAYSRKDRQTKARDPVTTRYIAQLFEAAGANAVLTLDVHNEAAFQNAFRCTTLSLSMRELYAQDIAARADGRPLAVVSPDPGGVKRAQLLREAVEDQTGIGTGFGLMEKRRSAGVVSGTLFAGDVEGRVVHVVDDMICGGGTMRRAAEALREHGAAEVHAIATHAMMDAGAADSLLADGLLDSLTLSDSTSPFGKGFPAPPRFRVIGCGAVIGWAIRSMASGSPLSDLLPPGVHLVDGGQ